MLAHWNMRHAWDIIDIVALGTTLPNPIQTYHYKLKNTPFPRDPATVWAKCGFIASVGIDRLDRVKITRGIYEILHISMDQVRKIRTCAAISIGVDIEPK